tara:strand:+ start:221 stop:598 length:378 start_codon:yes stop_codon:yes gene_type:complete
MFADRWASELIVAVAALDLVIKILQPELSRPGRRIHHIAELPFTELQLFIHPITPQRPVPGSANSGGRQPKTALLDGRLFREKSTVVKEVADNITALTVGFKHPPQPQSINPKHWYRSDMDRCSS